MSNKTKPILLITGIVFILSFILGFINIDSSMKLYINYYLLLFSMVIITGCFIIYSEMELTLPIILVAILFNLLNLFLNDTSFYSITSPYLVRFLVSLAIISWLKGYLSENLFSNWMGDPNWNQLERYGVIVIVTALLLTLIIFIVTPINAFMNLGSDSLNEKTYINNLDKYLMIILIFVLSGVFVFFNILKKGEEF